MDIAGLSGDQAMSLQVYQGRISMSGLLLAGFIIGALGVPQRRHDHPGVGDF